jgi:hypothetical protein
MADWSARRDPQLSRLDLIGLRLGRHLEQWVLLGLFVCHAAARQNAAGGKVGQVSGDWALGRLGSSW